MKFERLHRWPTTPKAAIELQRRWAERVVSCPIAALARWYAGVDVAFSKDGKNAIAGVVVWDSISHSCVESVVRRASLTFPYVPGLLSFREIPVVLRAFSAITQPVDVVLCDAQGRAHPRRFGLACHLGLWLDRPTVGCAKSRLCGEHAEPQWRRGAVAHLIDKGEVVGAVVRTRDRVRPLYVSAGHLCDLESAIALTLAATPRYRLPEPTRLAHQLVTRARNAGCPVESRLA